MMGAAAVAGARTLDLRQHGFQGSDRGSKVTFVPRGHVRACHSQGTCGQWGELLF